MRRILKQRGVTSIAAIGLVLLSSRASRAEIPEAVLLYPQGAPGAQGTEPGDQPAIRIYSPDSDRNTGAAVVICPGGGYGILATDHEGHQVARWFQRQGITGVVLRYRHAPKYRHPVPLQDAQQAIRHVREQAERLHLSRDRIGIMGFSAGGHLASTAATHFPDEQPADGANAISARPDFAILGYPVISFVQEFGHKGSMRNLLGDDPDPELVRNLSNETQVTARTPPTFLFHTGEDSSVPVANSLSFYQALVEAGVPAELHVYQNGPHGLGLAPGDPAVHTWKERLLDWMQTNGFLADVKRAAVSGSVTLNGQPLRWGTITFIPNDGQRKPVASAMISRGKYSIPASRGVVVGENRVVLRSLGDVLIDPTIDDVIELGSGLVIQALEDGNTFDFSLESE